MKKTIKTSNELKSLLKESFSLQIELNYLDLELSNIIRKIKDYQYKNTLPDFVVEYTSQGEIINVYDSNELTGEESDELQKWQMKIVLDIVQKRRVKKITTLPIIKGRKNN